MGVSCSCPLAAYCDLESGFESITARSINLDHDNDQIMLARSTSFNRQDYVRLRTHQTMRFKEVQAEENKCAGPGQEMLGPVSGPNSPKHEAALKLQKVYKSFRTRRKLADCAVLIERSWWKLLDFAELKHSSISFFDIEKHETAISRWSRARTRAAKVGKGLSKNSKAQKMALQHWLEAIDPRHRYGHNLHFYYMKWLDSQSKEPFFYWLDIGEGKEVNLVDKSPRSKLQQQCIKYLGPIERKAYEVAVENGKLLYKETGELLDTTSEQKGSKWIFVLSTSRTLYVGKKKKGSFQHSSFLAGGATLAAGRVVAEQGVLKAVWPHSGHYRPTPENFQDFISFLWENNVDLADVKLDSIDDDEESSGKHKRSHSSGDDLTTKDHLDMEENDIKDSISDNVNNSQEEIAPEIKLSKLEMPHGLAQLSTLQIPSRNDLLERLKKLKSEKNTDKHPREEESFPLKPDEQEHETEEEEETIPEEHISQRINSHKGMKSFQLGKQLSCKWSTGAGPRIGCLRDYPSGLQSHALEQVNLSPRSNRRLRFDFPSRASTPSGSHLSRSSSRNLGGSSHM